MCCRWLTPEVLNAYDVFSPWAAHPVLGPFTVLRNNEVLRFAYKLVILVHHRLASVSVSSTRCDVSYPWGSWMPYPWQ